MHVNVHVHVHVHGSLYFFVIIKIAPNSIAQLKCFITRHSDGFVHVHVHVYVHVHETETIRARIPQKTQFLYFFIRRIHPSNMPLFGKAVIAIVADNEMLMHRDTRNLARK